MSNRLLKTVTLLAFTAFSTVALADDPPARVGRVALAQGQVSITSDDQPAFAAQVNWPVTSHQMLTTAPGARTELRIGSTSLRLDGGSALEVVELDDENLRVRLHYGSVSVRVLDPDTVAGFELTTPEVSVRLQEPGRMRVDAGRVRDTSAVNVFDGVALVDGGGEQLAVRAGRRAEVSDEDVSTAQAMYDSFDDWARARDDADDRSRSARYVGSDMTGYEELDRYGSWRTDAEYGALWIPAVGADWVPYRDGSWAWIEPWGWTWVDNAPWGYAPFHYGRWVHVHHRWAWAPGRHERHPVWAPAMVGWVGGSDWNVAFGGRRPMPARGWYPLSPYERYTPSYHASEQHLRWWNGDVRPDGRHEHERHEGLTAVPHDAFNQRGRVPVHGQPKATLGSLMQRVQDAAPPAPPPHAGRDHDRGHDHDRSHDSDRGQPRSGQPPLILTAPSVPQAQPPQRGWREREASEDGRRQHERETAAHWGGPAIARPAAAQAPAAPMQASPAPDQSESRFAQHGRPHGQDGEGERRMREPGPRPEPRWSAPQSPPALIPRPPQAPYALNPQPPQAPHALNPMPETARPFPLPPQAVGRPAPPAADAPRPVHHQPGDGHGRGGDERNVRQQER